MSKTKLIDKYFDWLCNLVGSAFPHRGFTYHKLLLCLFHIDFTYSIPLDENRANDGVNLRYHFGKDYDIDIHEIAYYLDNRPCSVLEMMVALAVRCEEAIMEDPKEGDRTGLWFWNMIINLELDSFDDSLFNEYQVRKIVDRFLNRQYEPSGKGGLFYVDDPYHDLRHINIWYQMMWYLDKYYD